MTAKTLDEINQQFECNWQEEKASSQQSKPKGSSIFSSIIFYTVIVLMVLGAFIYSQQKGNGTSFFGFSYFNILTNSMQSEMPAGTFILVKAVDPATIEIGDDITFFQNRDTVITHRVIDIYENYEDSFQYGFQTQGTDNLYPDKDITYEENVIGKVIWHVPTLGFIFEYIAENVFFILIIFGVIVLIVFLLRILFKPEKQKDKDGDKIWTSDQDIKERVFDFGSQSEYVIKRGETDE